MPSPLMPPEKVGARRNIPGGARQKWFLKDHERKMIMDLYDGTKSRTDQIQRAMPHIPRYMICRWAMQLGLVPPKDRWTLEQEKFLRKNLRRMTMKDLAKYLKKDRNSIRRKAVIMGLYKEKKSDGYSMNEFMMGIGVQNDDRVYKWIENGWLKGKKVTTEFSNVAWYFTDKAIREFIFAHPEELDQRKFDWLWIVDILAGDKGLGRLDEDHYGERIS